MGAIFLTVGTLAHRMCIGRLLRQVHSLARLSRSALLTTDTGLSNVRRQSRHALGLEDYGAQFAYG
jgi:hypothetical protein